MARIRWKVLSASPLSPAHESTSEGSHAEESDGDGVLADADSSRLLLSRSCEEDTADPGLFPYLWLLLCHLSAGRMGELQTRLWK